MPTQKEIIAKKHNIDTNRYNIIVCDKIKLSDGTTCDDIKSSDGTTCGYVISEKPEYTCRQRMKANGLNMDDYDVLIRTDPLGEYMGHIAIEKD